MVNGLHFGPDGLLYLASVMSPALASLDPETGEIRERLGPSDGAMGPDDLAFDADGRLCWTDIFQGEVRCRDPGGVAKLVGSPGPGVNPITFSDDGRLFVSQCFMDHRLFELDPEGNEEPRLISDQLGPGCGLNGMDWGPDGKLYGPRWFMHQVARVDVDTGTIETVAEGFNVPAAVKFDSKGRLHVLDSGAGEVVRVDVATGEREVVGRIRTGLDNLAFDAEDRLFVSSYADGDIVEVVDRDHYRTVIPGGINMPGGLALVGPAGEEALFVAQFLSLKKVDPSDGSELGIVRDLLGVTAIGSVHTVSPRQDHLILTSWFEGSVKLWNPENDSLVARFDGFQQPLNGIAFGENIVVAELGSASVFSFHPDRPNDRETLAEGLRVPAGLVAHGVSLFVSEQGGGRILQLVDGGETLRPPREIASGLDGPEGIAIRDDMLFIIEAGAGRVTRMGVDGGNREVLAEGLELQIEPQVGMPATNSTR